jgi:hypothetical protein
MQNAVLVQTYILSLAADFSLAGISDPVEENMCGWNVGSKSKHVETGFYRGASNLLAAPLIVSPF